MKPSVYQDKPKRGKEIAMRRSFQRIISLTFIAILLMSMLSACGAATDTPTTVSSTTTTAPAADTPTTAAVADTPTAVAMAATPTTATVAATATTASGSTTITGTTAPKPPTATPYPTVPAAAGSTKLTFWYGLTGFNGGVTQEVVNRFNTSQTKYYVEAIQQPNYDDTINKLNASLAGGDLPNIVQIYDIGTQRMIDTKRILPVQDFLDKEKSDIAADLEPAVASYYTVNGKLYSMPFNSSAPVMYYDKNAFKEVGLDPEKPPTTYDELFEAAKKLVKKDASGKIIRSGVDFTLYGWILEQEMAIQTAAYAEPGNGRGSERATKVAFNGEAGQNWLNFLKKLQDEGVGRSLGRHSGTTNGTTLGANFSKGDAAIAFESIATCVAGASKQQMRAAR